MTLILMSCDDNDEEEVQWLLGSNDVAADAISGHLYHPGRTMQCRIMQLSLPSLRSPQSMQCK